MILILSVPSCAVNSSPNDVKIKTFTPQPKTTIIPSYTNPPLAVADTQTPTPASIETTIPPADSIPNSHYIRKITGHKQYFPLGCETSATVDWALYFGKIINEYEFQASLPQSDNPDFGFVGGLEGPWGQVPPYSYGVHAGPIASILRQTGFTATGYKGFTLQMVKEQIARDQPVIAWVIGNVVGGIPYEYTDKRGNKVVVAAYEHVVIITGYDSKTIRYMNNGAFYEVPDEVFLNSWGVLGNMVVVKSD